MSDKVICPGCGQTFPVCGAGMWDIQEHQARSKRCQQAQHRAEAEAGAEGGSMKHMSTHRFLMDAKDRHIAELQGALNDVHANFLQARRERDEARKELAEERARLNAMIAGG